jgi:glyceraldehyde 3-phosphate dehydrogenase
MMRTIVANYGRWPKPVRAEGDTLRVGERVITYFNVKDGLPDWGKLAVDVVIACTGRAVTRPRAPPHLDRGAR